MKPGVLRLACRVLVFSLTFLDKDERFVVIIWQSMDILTSRSCEKRYLRLYCILVLR